MACRTCASAKWPIRHLAMTGMDTAAMMPSIMSGSLIRATPPWARMSAGTRSSAITATAPASSAILAWSGVTTSMITPPLSISAMPRLTRAVPVARPEEDCVSASIVDNSEPHLLARDCCVHGRAAAGQRAGRFARPLRRGQPASAVPAFSADQGVVHLEELRGRGPAGQAQDAGQRAAAARRGSPRPGRCRTCGPRTPGGPPPRPRPATRRRLPCRRGRPGSPAG